MAKSDSCSSSSFSFQFNAGYLNVLSLSFNIFIVSSLPSFTSSIPIIFLLNLVKPLWFSIISPDHYTQLATFPFHQSILTLVLSNKKLWGLCELGIYKDPKFSYWILVFGCLSSCLIYLFIQCWSLLVFD